jgi:hypothetical protein
MSSRSRLAVALLTLPAAASAQAVDRSTARRVVEAVAAAVEQNYVFPDTGRMIGDHLRARLRAGAYDTTMETGRLTDRLSKDMKAVNGDLHLYATLSARPGQPAGGAQMVRRRPGDPLPANVLTDSRRANHNIHRAERLAGNVGYISIGQLTARNAEAYEVFDAAMAFLGRTDAMILDLRRTNGGNPQMSDYVASYFLGDSTRTLSSYDRAANQTFERWTRAVGGRKRPDVPVYLLVGPGTASGAEDLAFIFKQSGRGTLVGERTAGAGRLTQMYPVGDGFSVSVSGGRTFDPRTGAEWERVGIQPDISGGEDALTAAHASALERLAAVTADSGWRQSLLLTRETALARAKGVAVPAATLREYAGTYDLRVIRFERGKLWYHRDASRAGEELTPIDDHTFALGESARVEFVRGGGRVTGMKVKAPGQDSLFPRS